MFEKQVGDTAHSKLRYLVKCSNKGGDTAQNSKMFEKQGGGTPHIPLKGIWSDVQTGGDTAHKKVKEYKCCGVGGFYIGTIMPLRGSILQVGTCKILSLAEYPRWSRVWQLFLKN